MKIKKAVSVIITYKNEVFVIKRKNSLRSFPGYLAFVGGKVDKEDFNAKDPLLNAVKREVEEELGIDIDSFSHSMSKFCEVTSPSFNPIRFETFFYHLRLFEKPDFTLCEHEIAQGIWSKPQTILDSWKEGNYLIIPPIRFMLSLLASNIELKEASYTRSSIDGKVPWVEVINDLIQYMPLSHTLPPATRTNCFYINGDKKFIVDPSPKNEQEKQKLLNSIDKVDFIFLTHYHGDHIERSNEIAIKLNVPIYLSKDTKRLIENKQEHFFKGVETKIIKDRDVIGSWKQSKIICYDISGHAKGHFGIMPENKKWFIVGDIFQGVGSVVVGGQNASMLDYMNTLKMIIKEDPKCVIPSHGIALGGTHIIEKNLKHRQLREEQVEKLYFKLDKDINKIYEHIYVGLNEKLKPYAMANIKSHLDKLKTEKRI
ncbi:MAG: MBL fold metallo-hydrolase [Bacteriovoracaceae bacterium]|nr:MBL fold metallo-hydrolase [Bacteriovoracaceae bacterium]